MRIKILQDGDKVISVTSDFVVVERISGEVVEVETENGVKITNF